MLKRVFPFIILSFLLLPIVWPLLQPGFFSTDDGNWMVIRLSAFHETLRSGQFPVRFVLRLNHSYGYPVLNFLYPLPFYLGEALHLIGFSFLNSIKILFTLSFLFSAWGMYQLVKEEWGKQSGFIAAIFYSVAPYHLFDVYKRGSIGEAVAFVFPPLIFLFMQRYFKEKNKSNLIFAAIFLAFLITAHNVVAFLFLPVLILYQLAITIRVKNKKESIINNLSVIILSLGLSAFFWLPALFDLQFTRAALIQVSNFSDNFVSSENFLQTLGIFIPLIIIASTLKAINQKRKNIILILIFTSVSLLFVFPLSNIFWNLLPLPRLVQFPWRFLSLAVFSSSILCGYLFSKIKNWLIIAVVASLMVGYSASQINITPEIRPDGFYSTNEDSTTVKNEYMPKWVKTDFTQRPAEDLKISKGIATANQLFFPGQVVTVDGVETVIWPSNNGLLNFFISQGKHDVKVSFHETPWRLFADLVSVISTIVAIFSIFVLLKKSKNKTAPVIS